MFEYVAYVLEQQSLPSFIDMKLGRDCCSSQTDKTDKNKKIHRQKNRMAECMDVDKRAPLLFCLQFGIESHKHSQRCRFNKRISQFNDSSKVVTVSFQNMTLLN